MQAIKVGLRQKVIAEAMGVSGPTMSRWLCGTTPVPPDRANQLATILKITVDEVLSPDIATANAEGHTE
jgi:transcriptional regulator with XRE-family HTH domain